MVDLTQEKLIGLTEVAKLAAVDGRPPHISTVYRWALDGVRGVQLEHCRLGKRICTSKEALVRFSQELAERDALKPEQGLAPKRGPSPGVRERQVEAAEARLAEARI